MDFYISPFIFFVNDTGLFTVYSYLKCSFQKKHVHYSISETIIVVVFL